MNVMLAKMKIAGLNAAFMGVVQGGLPPWQDAALLVPSGKSAEDYGWLGDVAELEEWRDELIPRGLLEFGFSIRNKRFGGAIEFEIDDLNDDQYGQAKLRVQDLADKGRQYPGRLISSLRAAGETTLCYDGQYFHSTTHSEGSSGTQSNLHTGTGTSDAQIQADTESALALMGAYKTDKGTPIVRTGRRLVGVCAPALEIKLRRALMLQTLSAGGQNVFAGLLSDIEVDPLLTGNSWYIEDRAPRVKAYIVQEREALSAANTGLGDGSETFVLRDRIIYRAKWRGNVGMGLWQHSVKIKNS